MMSTFVLKVCVGLGHKECQRIRQSQGCLVVFRLVQYKLGGGAAHKKLLSSPLSALGAACCSSGASLYYLFVRPGDGFLLPLFAAAICTLLEKGVPCDLKVLR